MNENQPTVKGAGKMLGGERKFSPLHMRDALTLSAPWAAILGGVACPFVARSAWNMEAFLFLFLVLLPLTSRASRLYYIKRRRLSSRQVDLAIRRQKPLTGPHVGDLYTIGTGLIPSVVVFFAARELVLVFWGFGWLLIAVDGLVHQASAEQEDE